MQSSAHPRVPGAPHRVLMSPWTRRPYPPASGASLNWLINQFLLLIPVLTISILSHCPHNTHGVVILKTLSERVMTTHYGKIRGILVEFPNPYLKPVEAYLGLRYADHDSGAMRFMPPQNPKDRWNQIRVAIKHQPVCPQPRHNHHDQQDIGPRVSEGRSTHLRNITPFLTDMTEDCLSLNLYVPVSGE